ncbi:dcd1A, partial [Symbiodinium sp. KB8]
MGYAHGALLKDVAKGFVDNVWAYFEQQVRDSIDQFGLPEWLADMIEDVGLDVALGLTYDLTKNFTGQYFFDEMRGMSDATGIDYERILHIHMIGELTKGTCSMFGAWGSAVAVPGTTLQLRALDWNVDGPFKDYPAVVVYHPSAGWGNNFANLGFVGWIGTLSGQSDQHMAVSEIGISFPDSSFGNESRIGVPFTFILRDMLQDSQHRLSTANRTCYLVLGVGDGKEEMVNAVKYSYSVAYFMNDMVYEGMDWLCPTYQSVSFFSLGD